MWYKVPAINPYAVLACICSTSPWSRARAQAIDDLFFFRELTESFVDNESQHLDKFFVIRASFHIVPRFFGTCAKDQSRLSGSTQQLAACASSKTATGSKPSKPAKAPAEKAPKLTQQKSLVSVLGKSAPAPKAIVTGPGTKKGDPSYRAMAAPWPGFMNIGSLLTPRSIQEKYART